MRTYIPKRLGRSWIKKQLIENKAYRVTQIAELLNQSKPKTSAQREKFLTYFGRFAEYERNGAWIIYRGLKDEVTPDRPPRKTNWADDDPWMAKRFGRKTSNKFIYKKSECFRYQLVKAFGTQPSGWMTYADLCSIIYGMSHSQILKYRTETVKAVCQSSDLQFLERFITHEMINDSISQILGRIAQKKKTTTVDRSFEIYGKSDRGRFIASEKQCYVIKQCIKKYCSLGWNNQDVREAVRQELLVDKWHRRNEDHYRAVARIRINESHPIKRGDVDEQIVLDTVRYHLYQNVVADCERRYGSQPERMSSAMRGIEAWRSEILGIRNPDRLYQK